MARTAIVKPCQKSYRHTLKSTSTMVTVGFSSSSLMPFHKKPDCAVYLGHLAKNIASSFNRFY